MTLTISIEGKGIIANSDALINDTGGTGTGDWGKVGNGSLSLSTETFLFGSSCVALAVSNEHSALYFDLGVGNELDFSTTGSEAGQFIYMWVFLPTPGLQETMANDGTKIRLYTTLSDYRDYIITASDDTNGWDGGWRCFVVDPTKPGSISDTGTYDEGSIRYIGVDYDATSVAKGDNVFIDQMAVGTGLRITGTSGSGWAEAVAYCTDYPNRAWGVLQEKDEIYYAYGKIYIGDSTQTAATSFTDEGRVIKFGSTEYYYSGEWVPTADVDFEGIIIEDASGYATTFEDGVLVGSDAGRTGSVIIGNDNHDVELDMFGGNNTGSLTRLYGTTFRNIKGDIVFGNDSDHRMYSVSFEDCSQVDPVGAVEIRNCLFVGYTSASDAALLWNSNIDIRNCGFIANANPTSNSHAIEHPVYGEYIYYDLAFSGNDYDIYFTDTSGSLVINASGTSNPDSYETTSGSVFINNTKSYTLQNLVVGSEVRAYAGANPVTAVEIDGVESSGSDFTFQHQEGGNQGYIIIHKTDYVPITIELTYPTTDTAVPVSQRLDYAYDNP